MNISETKISKLRLVPFGTVMKPSGFKGELLLKSDLDSIPDTNIFFVETDGYVVPFFLEDNKVRFQANKNIVVKFDSFKSDKEAESIVNCKVLVREDSVIEEEAEQGGLYDGFIVFNDMIEVGVVDSLMDIPGNPVLSVFTQEKKEILIPLNEHFIKNINMMEKKIYFSLPDGLLDLN